MIAPALEQNIRKQAVMTAGGVYLGGILVSIAVGATTAPVWVTALVVGVAVVGLGLVADKLKDKINDKFIHGQYAK